MTDKPRSLFLVPPPVAPVAAAPSKPVEPDAEIRVTPMGDGRFTVSISRWHGTSVATVVYTREQIEELHRCLTGMFGGE